jgi:hypothetical protein
MQPCIDAVRAHVAEFLNGLKTNQQVQWDWRLEFVAHWAVDNLFANRTLHSSNLALLQALYGKGGQGQGQGGGSFFTTDLETFRKGLEDIEVGGDESPLVALDLCLDLPWRPAETCHRVVILLTDEPFESGCNLDLQRSRLEDLKKKIMALKVMLFIVAPQSDVFEDLSGVSKCEYEVVDANGDGLSRVDLRKVLGFIGKSVSKASPNQLAAPTVQRSLYGQADWVAGHVGELTGK